MRRTQWIPSLMSQPFPVNAIYATYFSQSDNYYAKNGRYQNYYRKCSIFYNNSDIFHYYAKNGRYQNYYRKWNTLMSIHMLFLWLFTSKQCRGRIIKSLYILYSTFNKRIMFSIMVFWYWTATIYIVNGHRNWLILLDLSNG